MLTIGICDDITEDLLRIHTYLTKYFSPNNIQANISVYKSGHELLNSPINLRKFDILFLDVRMPQLNGIDIGREVRRHNQRVKIIYITGYLEYIRPAVDTAHCFFYLLKPITYEQLAEKLTIVLDYIKESQQKIELISNKTKWYYSASEIYYFERIDRKTYVRTTAKTSIYIYTPIIELAEKLKDLGFASPHRSFLVNMEHIRSMTESNILLSNKVEISLAQRKSASFKIAYNAYLQKCLIQ